MKTHRFQRSGKHPDIPLGAMQLCFSFRASDPPAQSQDEEQRVALVQTDFHDFSRALVAAYRDLGLRVAYTVEHAHKLERLFLRMRERVQQSLALWEQSEWRGDQNVLWQSRRLYRTLGEALVVVRGVGGLCATNRHLDSPTGSFWQLVDWVRLLHRDCQTIATHWNHQTICPERSVSVRNVLSA